MYGGLMDVSPRDNEKIKFRIKLSESHFYPLKIRRFGRPSSFFKNDFIIIN